MATIDIMLPVYNEERSLTGNIERLRLYLSELHLFPHIIRIVIVDNASTDTTGQLGATLAATYPDITYLHLPKKGRGYALKEAWRASTADVVSYMDIDLSTSLSHIPDLILPLVNNETDITYGSRLSKTSSVAGRTLVRELLSRGYNSLLHFFMGATFNDAQCGFKAMRREHFNYFYHNVADDAWFFDTELLLKMQYRGYRLREVPVIWLDDPNSTVNIRKTVTGDLRGMARLYRQERPNSPFHRLFSFALIGTATTLGYGLMYAALHHLLGSQISNLLTLVTMTMLNISLNRHFTYRQYGHARLRRHYGAGFGAFLLAWFISGVGLWVAQGFYPHMGATEESITVTALSVFATILKYIIFAIAFRTPQDKDTSVQSGTTTAHHNNRELTKETV